MKVCTYTKQCEQERLKDVITLLNCLQSFSVISFFPHATVSYMLFRCRFCDRKQFRSLVSEFINLGYNPLRTPVSMEEEICLKNIIARL